MQIEEVGKGGENGKEKNVDSCLFVPQEGVDEKGNDLTHPLHYSRRMF